MSFFERILLAVGLKVNQWKKTQVLGAPGIGFQGDAPCTEGGAGSCADPQISEDLKQAGGSK